MHKQGLFTSGEASGMTRIPGPTLRRYVLDYPEFFTEGAKKHNRGKRFTPQDIERLDLIRHLYDERFSSENIRAALAGEWKPPNLPHYERENLIKIIEETRQQVELARQNAKRSFLCANRSESLSNSFEFYYNRVLKDQKEIRARLDRIERVLKLDKFTW